MPQPAGVGSQVNRELQNTIRVAKCMVPKVSTVTSTGTDVNLKLYESATFDIAVGVAGDALTTSLFQTFVFQHADDTGTGSPGAYAACAVTDLMDDPLLAVLSTTGTIVLTNTTTLVNRTYQIGYIGQKQWVRAIVQTTGTHTTGTPLAVNVIKGHARIYPAVQ